MKLIKKIEKKIFGKYKNLIQALAPFPGKLHRHIFVVGVQRSGTNMVMEIFDRSMECTVFHDHDPRANDNYIQRDTDTLKQLSDAANSEFVVFKPMTELHKLDIFLAEMAPAQGIWLYRNVEDVVNSHLKLWTGMPDFLRIFIKDRQNNDWRGGGISDENYAFLQQHITDDLNNASAIALFWFYRNAQFFEHQYFSNPNIHIVNYDDYVTDPQRHFRKLINTLGLKTKPYMTRHIHAKSIRKNAKPPIDGKIMDLCRILDQRFQNHFRQIK